jgi:hypothetical protein
MINTEPKPALLENNLSWESLSSCEHIVHIYENDEDLMETLEKFIIGGLRTGESVIAIATSEHLAEMNERLNAYGVDLAQLREHYICIDAEFALSKFLINDWPDEELFTEFVTDLVERASSDGRRVRAFGEMVATLWANGNKRATIKLEQLWNKYCHTGAFPLLCAYPKSGFQSKSASIKEICAAHSKVIAAMDWLTC